MGSTKSWPGAIQTRCVVYTDRHSPSNFCFFVPSWPSQPHCFFISSSPLSTPSLFGSISIYSISLSFVSWYLLSWKLISLPCWQRINFEGGIRVAEGEGKDLSWWLISCYRQLITMRGEYIKSLGRVRWWTWFCECRCIVCFLYRMSSRRGYKLVWGRGRNSSQEGVGQGERLVLKTEAQEVFKALLVDMVWHTNPKAHLFLFCLS